MRQKSWGRGSWIRALSTKGNRDRKIWMEIIGGLKNRALGTSTSLGVKIVNNNAMLRNIFHCEKSSSSLSWLCCLSYFSYSQDSLATNSHPPRTPGPFPCDTSDSVFFNSMSYCFEKQQQLDFYFLLNKDPSTNSSKFVPLVTPWWC